MSLWKTQERLTRPGRSCSLRAGLIGFDGSVRQKCSSGSWPTTLAQPGNPNANDMDHSVTDLTFPESWVRESALVAA